VYFFDTPDLALDAAGVVVRARRIQNASGDTVLKLRPVVPDKIPDEVRRDAAFSIEVDAMPGGFVCRTARTSTTLSRWGR
jgi:type IV secretory pathway ATPase VirB11/archaellum biosynthesis ATPase